MHNPSLFDTILIYPIVNLLVAVYQFFLYLHLPGAFGFAIIGLTVLVRLILYPFIHAQLTASKKMQALTPHLSSLKEKHKGDAKRIQEETMKLYKEHGVNPLGGCLPVIIQFPLIIALYTVLQHVVSLDKTQIVSYVNNIVYFDSLKLKAAWDAIFFGIPLGAKASDLVSHMPLLFLIPVITGLLQYYQSKLMVPAKVAEKAIVKAKKGKEEVKKTDTASDFAAAFQTQSLYIFPIMIGYFSYSFPLGLSLYWNMFTLFGILQQLQVNKKQ